MTLTCEAYGQLSSSSQLCEAFDGVRVTPAQCHSMATALYLVSSSYRLSFLKTTFCPKFAKRNSFRDFLFAF